MSELKREIPLALVTAWSNYGAVSGAVIDRQFIDRGFSGVQAQIDFIRSVYGPNAYEADIEAHSSLEAFMRMRGLADEIDTTVAIALNGDESQLDSIWLTILDDPRLPSFLKQDALRNLSNERYEALIAPHVPALKKALLEEQSTVCRLYVEPAIALLDKEAISLRKEVFNAVMSDAYGALGFEAVKKKQKVNIYRKQLSSSYAVVIEPDVVTLGRDCRLDKRYRSPLIYWPLLTYDKSCYLTSASGEDKFFHFSSGVRSIASERRCRYDSTLSLEVMVRADALWCEIALAPFEQIVKQIES
ncbi:hypothetical protein [Pseudomonas sp. CGJS7]|uniref:hypothetical protein n=1 Tax=Pseudomonas sp. CGJS7 TaxID=3109348 RepID=UPI00300817A1